MVVLGVAVAVVVLCLIMFRVVVYVYERAFHASRYASKAKEVWQEQE